MLSTSIGTDGTWTSRTQPSGQPAAYRDRGSSEAQNYAYTRREEIDARSGSG